MRIDFHSHILPGMDDGASSVKESISMLKRLSAAGVDRVVLTPHFYRQNEKIEKFLSRRQEAYEKLCEAVSIEAAIPEIVLGAEVYFYPSLSSDPEFGKLCIEGTGYVLLELPFERFYDNFFADFTSFLNRCEYKIILAHAERYLRFGNTVKDIERLKYCGDIICQINCSSISDAGFFQRRQILGLLESGIAEILGTDAHNMKSRPPEYDKAEKIIRKKCGNSAFEQICKISGSLFNDQPVNVEI